MEKNSQWNFAKDDSTLSKLCGTDECPKKTPLANIKDERTKKDLYWAPNTTQEKN